MKNEKRNRIVSVRLTENEYQKSVKQASENHQSISRYIAEAAGRTQGLSLSKKQSIYSSLVIIRDAVRQTGTAENQKITYEECDKIWKSISN